MIGVLFVGCVTPKRATLVVPARCMKMRAESFTRPCVQRQDGKLQCDGVVVTATCTEVSQRWPANGTCLEHSRWRGWRGSVGRAFVGGMGCDQLQDSLYSLPRWTSLRSKGLRRVLVIRPSISFALRVLTGARCRRP